jgi:uncharacterized HAD superfamily protein
MIEPTHAFKTGDGTCHENKQHAYNADITHMYRTLPLSKDKKPVAKEFNKFVRKVKEWLESAIQLDKQMKQEADTETARSIVGQG